MAIILEPIGKNTAPAITLGALIASQTKEDNFLIILSSDHIIRDTLEFKKTIIRGLEHADNGEIVTFGIEPKTPECGYGYIESYNELSKDKKSSKIKRFIEKPDISIARKLIKDKHFSWNSGIFLFKASSIVEELKKFVPDVVENCKKSLDQAESDLDFIRINKDIFSKCPNVAVDTAVMENTSMGTVIRLDAGWSDIGSWESIWENAKKDNLNNSIKGKGVLSESEGCYLRSENRLVVGLGIKDLIIVETDDAVLIANKKSTQKVKNIVKDLQTKNFLEGRLNRKLYRPWGNFTSIASGPRWQVKRLEINPGESLSLQMHFHRSEHWVIVNGIAKVEIDNKETFLQKSESIYVPLRAKHRLSNPGQDLLVIIEVQNGEYLGEDDIVRFQDFYGRGNST